MASSRKTCGALSANGKKLVEGIMIDYENLYFKEDDVLQNLTPICSF